MKTNKVVTAKVAKRPKLRAIAAPQGLRVLTDGPEGKIAFTRLKRVLATKGTKHKVSVPSLGKTCMVDWHDEADIWSTAEVGKGGRIYQIRFGQDDPRHHKTVTLALQFNIPVKGSNMHLAGVFVADDAEKIYLAHSGNIAPRLKGGGARALRNLNKAYEEYHSEVVSWPNGKKRRLVFVTRLDDERALERIGDFVRTVMKLKLVIVKSSAKTGPAKS